ncbi:MAG: hypothetical protein AAF585_27680 [Verrucomicrobiota bacterium]
MFDWPEPTGKIDREPSKTHLTSIPDAGVLAAISAESNELGQPILYLWMPELGRSPARIPLDIKVHAQNAKNLSPEDLARYDAYYSTKIDRLRFLGRQLLIEAPGFEGAFMVNEAPLLEYLRGQWVRHGWMTEASDDESAYPEFIRRKSVDSE